MANGVLNGAEAPIKNAVYKIKDEIGNYKRYHFETSSVMIYDATSSATASKVVIRDAKAGASFNEIQINSCVNSGSNVTRGLTTLGEGLSEGANALVVADKRRSVLGGDLEVRGASSFQQLATFLKGISVLGTTTLDTLVAEKATLGTTIIGGTNKPLTVNGLSYFNDNVVIGKDSTPKNLTIKGTMSITSNQLVVNLNADKVDGKDVNDSSSSVDSLWTANKIDTTKANKATKILGGTSISVTGGTLGADSTITHSNVTRADGVFSATTTVPTVLEVIQSIESNSQGHITKANRVNLDARYANKKIEITAGGGINVAGSGDLSSSKTISHADTSNQASISTTAPTMIQNISLDTYGHITGMTSYNLDNRYFTQAQVNDLLAGQVVDLGNNLVGRKKFRDQNENGVFFPKFSMEYNASTDSIDFIFV